MTTTIRAVPGFLPSTAGFHFANQWPHGPAIRLAVRVPGPVPVELELRIGDTANGLCGGMALATIDRWLVGEPPPPDLTPPPEGSDLFREIVRRQIDSLGWGLAVARFWRSGAVRPSTRARLAVRDAWPAIRREIDAGRPAAVGLTHVASADPRSLIGDHQVVVHGYELDAIAGTVVLWIYDPNHPDDDAIRLRLTLGGVDDPLAIEYVAGEAPVLGLVRL